MADATAMFDPARLLGNDSSSQKEEVLNTSRVINGVYMLSAQGNAYRSNNLTIMTGYQNYATLTSTSVYSPGSSTQYLMTTGPNLANPLRSWQFAIRGRFFQCIGFPGQGARGAFSSVHKVLGVFHQENIFPMNLIDSMSIYVNSEQVENYNSGQVGAQVRSVLRNYKAWEMLPGLSEYIAPYQAPLQHDNQFKKYVTINNKNNIAEYQYPQQITVCYPIITNCMFANMWQLPGQSVRIEVQWKNQTSIPLYTAFQQGWNPTFDNPGPDTNSQYYDCCPGADIGYPVTGTPEAFSRTGGLVQSRFVIDTIEVRLQISSVDPTAVNFAPQVSMLYSTYTYRRDLPLLGPPAELLAATKENTKLRFYEPTYANLHLDSIRNGGISNQMCFSTEHNMITDTVLSFYPSYTVVGGYYRTVNAMSTAIFKVWDLPVVQINYCTVAGQELFRRHGDTGADPATRFLDLQYQGVLQEQEVFTSGGLGHIAATNKKSLDPVLDTGLNLPNLEFLVLPCRNKMTYYYFAQFVVDLIYLTPRIVKSDYMIAYDQNGRILAPALPTVGDGAKYNATIANLAAGDITNVPNQFQLDVTFIPQIHTVFCFPTSIRSLNSTTGTLGVTQKRTFDNSTSGTPLQQTY